MEIESGDLVVGLMMAGFGLIGLFLAAGAHDNEMYVFGCRSRASRVPSLAA